MKNIFGCLFLTLFSFSAFSATLNENVTYAQKFGSGNQTTQFPQWIDDFFQNRKTVSFDSPGSPRPLNVLDWAPRIYATSDLNKFIIVKSDLEVKGNFQTGTIYQADPEEYLVHLKTGDGPALTAFFFVGFDETKVKSIVKDLQDKKIQAYTSLNGTVPSRSFLGARFFLPSAFAGTRISDACHRPSVSPQEAKDQGVLWGCMKGIVGGAWDATGGSVVSAGKDAVHLGKVVYQTVVNPLQTFHAIENGFKKAVNFVSDFSLSLNPFKDLQQTFMGLEPKVKAKLICELASSVGTAVLLSYASFGTASPVVFGTMANILKGMGASSKIVLATEKFATKAAEIETKLQSLQKTLPVQAASVLSQLTANSKNLVILSQQRAALMALAAKAEVSSDQAAISKYRGDLQQINQKLAVTNQNTSKLTGEFESLHPKLSASDKSALNLPTAPQYPGCNRFPSAEALNTYQFAIEKRTRLGTDSKGHPISQ